MKDIARPRQIVVTAIIVMYFLLQSCLMRLSKSLVYLIEIYVFEINTVIRPVKWSQLLWYNEGT